MSKKLIVMSLDEQFPQPSAAELAAAGTRWKLFNQFQWRILQGLGSNVNQPHLWPDHNADLETKLTEMLIEDELPECPAPTLWVKTFDLTVSDGGWAVVAAGNGTLAAGIGWQATGSGAVTLHVKRTLNSASKVLGMNALINLQASGTAIRQAQLSVLNPAEQFIYSNLAQPNTDGEIAGSSTHENVTEIRVRLSVSSRNLACQLKRLTVWGEGSNPF